MVSKLFIPIFILHSVAFGGSIVSNDSTSMLLTNAQIQVEATQAVNDMYNFKFERAEMQFRWIKQKYPDHPLPYFLLGLSDWWKIMPNIDDETWDESFLGYMDLAIERAEELYEDENEQNKIEGAFFLAACYGQKGRLYSERRNWGKAANAGRLALKYHQKSSGNHDLSPEFLFGDALYNYYSVWIRENYPLLKPIMIPFPKGDKKLGIEQLKSVAGNAFYTRIEAQLFLMRILAIDENDSAGALLIADYLHRNYPDNPYFHRFYARMLYSNGKRANLEEECLDIIIKIDIGQQGYEQNSGRYAAFFLGQMYDSRGMDDEALKYYRRVIEFGDEIDAQETGYYLYSLLSMSRYAIVNEQYDIADEYLDKIRDNSRRKDSVNKQAREYQKKIKTARKNLRKTFVS